MSTLASYRQTMSKRLREGAQDSLFLVRAPAELWAGLKQRWLVPFLLLLSLLLVPALVLPSIDFLLEKIYPPVEKSQLFGLINTSQVDERLDARKGQAAVLAWLVALAAMGSGLVCYAPEVRRAAEAGKTAGSKRVAAEPETLAFGPAGRYRVVEKLGSGAMGVVYAAFDSKLERQVALKVLAESFVRDSERHERFRREALTLAQLAWPGIVQLYDLLEDGGRLILVLELVRGGTLEDLIAQRAPLTVAEACRLAAGICAALEHVQQQGIVHRDLKPANILLDDQGTPKVTDFGMARLRDSGMTLEGSIIGTPRYMSPEQAVGLGSDYRGDVYALGTILFELLTGTTPYIGEATGVLLQQASEEPIEVTKPLQGVDGELVDLLKAMLDKDPQQRLADLRLIRERLQAFAG